MTQSTTQQALEAIQRAQHILILGREQPDTDIVASVIGLGLILQKWEKSFDAVISQWDAKRRLAFLSDQIDIKPHIEAAKTLIINVDVKDVPLSEMLYNVQGHTLQIHLLPKHGAWTKDHVTVLPGEARHDLIICLGCETREALPSIMKEHPDLLHHTPVINVDCRASNEHWGHYNLVDPTAVSVTEQIHAFAESAKQTPMDASYATAVLAGMVARTKNFRTQQVTPRALRLSSELMDRGAKREEIMTHLWRTRSLPALKLWGRALARLEHDRDRAFIWTCIQEHDYLETGASPKDLEGIVDELIAYVPDAKAIAILLQRSANAALYLHASPPYSAADLARLFGGNGSRERALCTISDGSTFLETVPRIIEKIKEHLPPASTQA